MRSPFPGMDPYLESPTHWSDFHATFIQSLREVISDTLPDDYFARVQEDVLFLEPEPPGHKVVPDVLVGADYPSPARRSAPAAAGTLAPTTLENVVSLDPHVEHFIEIVRFPEAEAVTVVEVLSPTIKQNERAVYLTKRDRILRTDTVNLVEFDLLRAGRRVQLVQRFPAGHYHAIISRADDRPHCQVYSWTVRDRLQTIPIPLRTETPDASADLARAFELAYQRGRYGRMVRYDELPPPPAFADDDAGWILATARAATAR